MPSSQTSKAALDGLEKAEFAIMSIRTQQSKVSAALSRLYQPVRAGDGEGLPQPNWDLVQESNADLLVHVSVNVRTSDQTNRRNKVHLGGLLGQRRKLIGGLKTRRKDLRSSFLGTYGEESLPLVGLDSQAARAYLAFREQLSEIEERLRDEELTSRLGEPRSGQQPLALLEIADAMAADVAELETVLAEIKRTRKLLDESLIARQQALDEQHRVFINVSRVQEGYYRLAGLDELADRFRATRRKAARKADSKGAGDSSDGDSSDGDSSTGGGASGDGDAPAGGDSSFGPSEPAAATAADSAATPA